MHEIEILVYCCCCCYSQTGGSEGEVAGSD